MIVQHNIMAEFTARQNKINDRNASKHTKRLSSGYKVNTAADDAAALQISEKMRSQIRGLDKGVENLQDGISLVQVADGAMNEIQSMLHRLKELAVHSANGTLTDSDRGAIQAEAEQILGEMDRIAESTEFNTLPLLNNSWGEAKGEGISLRDLLGTGKITSSAHLNDTVTLGAGWQTTGNKAYGTQTTTLGPPNTGAPTTTINLTGPISPPPASAPAGATGWNSTTTKVTGGIKPPTTVTQEYTLNGNTVTETWISYGAADPPVYSTYAYMEKDPSQTIVKTISETVTAGYGSPGQAAAEGMTLATGFLDFSGLGTDYSLDDLIGSGFNTTCQTCNEHYSIYFVDNGGGGHVQKTAPSAGSTNPILEIDIRSIPTTGGSVTGADLAKELMSAIDKPGSVMGRHYTQYAYNPADPTKLYVYDNRTWYTENNSSGNPVSTATNASFEPTAFGRPTVKSEAKSPFPIQCKSEATQYLNIYLPWVTREKMGLTHIDLSTQENASLSLELIDKATDYLSAERSDIGAYQNRMEHAIANNENTSENLQAAESLLRDADMAEEMVAYTKDNILLQASQAMLSQANSAPSRILELLN